MARSIDPTLAEILRKYGADPKTDIWDCHGKWVAYHRALERIAVQAGITFDPPQVLEANGLAKSVALCVNGGMDSVDPLTRAITRRCEWSIGEAAPSNNKNSYPYAMAEKRAKDRVILKLIGLHGLVYSEEEMDEAVPPQKANGNASLDSQAIATDLIRELRQRKSSRDLKLWRESPAVADELKKLDEANYERVKGDYTRLMKEYQEKEKAAA